MKKTGKRIVGVSLALTMAFSSAAAAFAVSAAEEKEPVYTPTYNERVTEEKVGELLTTVDGLLDQFVWASYGSTVFSEVFGLLAGLGGDFATVDFWQKVDADLFKELSGDITTESMKAYLAEHPVAVSSADDLVANLEKALTPAIVGLLNMEISEGSPITGMIGTLAGFFSKSLADIDTLVGVLGADCGEKALLDILKSAAENVDQAAEDLTAYIMGIVDLVAPNTVDKLMTLVRTYSNNQAEILTALVNLMTDLNTNLNGAKISIGFVIKDKELLASIKEMLTQAQTVVQWINSALNANTVDGDKQAVDAEGKPVVDEDNKPVMEKVLDLDRVVNSILDGATGAFGGLVDIPDLSKFVKVTTEGTENTAMIKLSSVNDLIDSVAAESCDSNADVFNIVFNYAYDNLFGETNYNTLMTVLDLLPTLVPSITADTVNMIKELIPALKGNSALDMLDTIMVMTGVLEEEADPTPDPVPADPEGGSGNPATGDAAFAVVAGAGILAAGAVIVLARKKNA